MTRFPGMHLTTPDDPPADPAIEEIAGHAVVAHFGDPWAEYAALRTGAIVVDRSARGRMRMEGAQAGAMLTGLVTNDVTALTPGRGCYAATLTAKGRIVADVRIVAEESSYLIDAPVRARDGWLATVRKFVNPRLAPYRDISAETFDLGVFGVHARRIVSAASGTPAATLEPLVPYAAVPGVVAGAPVTVIRVPDLGVEGYEVIGLDADRVRVREALQAAGAVQAGLHAFEIARIEAGRPEWGIEMDDSTIPQEANFDELHAISYTKGCYTGQEVVARVHFRGHVNRHLRGLLCGDALPPRGATLLDDAGKPVGDVRSAVESPRLGRIGMAMVRREVLPGSPVRVRSEEGESRAEVVALPFPA